MQLINRTPPSDATQRILMCRGYGEREEGDPRRNVEEQPDVVAMPTRLRRTAGAPPPAGDKVERVGRWGPRAATVAAGALPVLAFPAPALW